MDKNGQKSLPTFEPNKYPLNPGLRFIEASAGTGKTFALAHLVLRLLTEKKQSANEILVVTFTEAAAAELKGRITTRLEETLGGIEAIEKGKEYRCSDEVLCQWLELKAQDTNSRYEISGLLLDALETIDRADITTIHGFCNRTLRREALNSGDSMNPVLEEDSSEIIQEIVHDYWRKEILSIPPKDLKGIKDAGLSIENICKGLQKIDSDPSFVFNPNIENLNTSQSLSDQFDYWLLKYWRSFVSSWQNEGLLLENSIKDQAAQWRSEGIKDTKPFSPKPRQNRHDMIDNWIKHIQENFEGENLHECPSYYEIRKQKLLGNYFHPGGISAVAQRCGEEDFSILVPQLQVAIAKLWDGPAEFIWEHALFWTLEVLNERRSKSGVISYGGLLKALDPGPSAHENIQTESKESSPLIRSLRSRYKSILIDEFQDTDSLQWRLLKQTFGDSSDHLLLMVGDPKQAIYRFRGGDLNVYMQARGLANRIDVLLDNFRTSPTLMNEINSLLSSGLKHSALLVPALNPRSKENNQHLTKVTHPLQILTIQSEITSDLNSESESTSSKSKIEQLIPTAVTNAILEILKVQKTSIQPSDICILVNRHDQASSIRESLAIAGLPSCLVQKGDVLASEAAQVLQRFLDCLAHPENSGKLRLLASSALMQWNLENLKDSERNGELDQLADRFKGWAKQLSKLGVLGCLSELLEGRTLADISARGRMFGDLQQCAQLVQEEIHRQGLDIMGAARWLRHQRLNPVEDIPSQREPHSDIAESAVNVLTIHRSKGLEYPIVICPYLWQPPPMQNTTIWRSSKNNNWLIALNHHWGKGKEAFQEAKKASIEEAERLAYVGITRARDQLILIWANSSKQEGNPLQYLLFGPNSYKSATKGLSLEEMNQWLMIKKSNINVRPAQTTEIQNYWYKQTPQGDLSLGEIPHHKLNKAWGRSSYSSWIKTNHNEQMKFLDPVLLEEGKDIDQENSDDPINKVSNTAKDKKESYWSSQSSLGRFPRGPASGDCLHKILERIDFLQPLDHPNTTNAIEEELRKTGLEIDLCTIVQEGLSQVLSTPIGGRLGNLMFNQLSKSRRIHELSFDLPIAQEGKQVQPLDLVNAFSKDKKARFWGNYYKKLANLNFSSQGFFTGSIDLVFTDQVNTKTARWWVADWKSNWIGSFDKESQQYLCGPMHYDDKAMENQMLIHHYPLQAHLYLVALHRFLKWRLPNYNPANHLGGYVYVFLRGVPGRKALNANSTRIKTPGIIIEEAPIARIIEIDQLLQNGGQ